MGNPARRSEHRTTILSTQQPDQRVHSYSCLDYVPPTTWTPAQNQQILWDLVQCSQAVSNPVLFLPYVLN
jgi:hypothetical protein